MIQWRNNFTFLNVFTCIYTYIVSAVLLCIHVHVYESMFTMCIIYTYMCLYMCMVNRALSSPPLNFPLPVLVAPLLSRQFHSTHPSPPPLWPPPHTLNPPLPTHTQHTPDARSSWTPLSLPSLRPPARNHPQRTKVATRNTATWRKKRPTEAT